MNPLLSGSATSDLPLIVFRRASSRSGTPMSQTLQERPPRTESSSTSHRPHRATTNREKRFGLSLSVVQPTFPALSSTSLPRNQGKNGRIQVTGPPEPRRPSEESFLPIPPLSPDIQRSPRAARSRATLKRRASVHVTSTLDQITLGNGVKPKQVTVSRSRSSRTHKEGLTAIGDDTSEEETRSSRVNPFPEPLAEKRRVMNVRRAKKMQQVRF